MENGDIWETDSKIFDSHPQRHHYTYQIHILAIFIKTHTSAVAVDDADSERAVLHAALKVEHGTLTCRHCHVAQLSCEKEQSDWC